MFISKKAALMQKTESLLPLVEEHTWAYHFLYFILYTIKGYSSVGEVKKILANKEVAKNHMEIYPFLRQALSSFWELVYHYPLEIDELFYPSKCVNPGKVLVFHANSQYANGLEKLALRLNIRHHHVNTETVWARDLFFEAHSKVYIRCKKQVRCEPNQYCAMEDFGVKDDSFIGLNYYKNKKYYAWDGDSVAHNPNDNTSLIQDLHGLGASLKPTARVLEGGNFFQAINQQGVTYYILGELTLLHELSLDFQKGKLSKAEILNKFEKKITEQKNKFAKIFATPHIVVVPQWTYHIDLQMAYVGNSTFLVHDFNETIRFLTNQRNLAESLAVARKLVRDRQSAIDKVMEILRASGFKVIQACLMLHKSACQPEMGAGIYSSFVNGLDLMVNETRYFLTSDSPVQAHKLYLIRLMAQLNIKTIFLSADHYSPAETVEIMDEDGGGLRCQSNWINNYQPLNHTLNAQVS